MPLQKIDVLVADPDHPDDIDHATTHRVTVLHGDRLVAEQRASENGIPHDGSHPQSFTALVIWNALRRTGVHNVPFQDFLPRILDTDAVPDPEPAPDHLEGLGDPTERTAQVAELSDSPSSSPVNIPESTGSPTSVPTDSTSTD